MSKKLPNPTSIKSHEVSRGKVCVVCLRKSDRPATDGYMEEIGSSTILLKSIQPLDQRVPTGICKTCALDLSKKIKGESGIKLKIPNEAFSYSKEVLILPNTRGNSGDEACACLICKIARANILGVHPYYGVTFKNISKIGRPQTVEKKAEFQFDDKDHINDKLMKLLKEDPKKAGQFAGQVIKSLPESPGGTKYLPQMFGGRDKAISEGKKRKIEATIVSHDQLSDFSNLRKFSQRGSKLFGTFLNSLKNVRVQSGFQKDLVLRDRELDDFYEGAYVDFLKSDLRPNDWLKDHPIVYAKNAEELLNHVCDQKGLIFQECVVQTFLDGGKGRLILSCCVFPADWEEVETPEGRKLSGVNHCIILAVSPKLPENHYNFAKIFALCQFFQLYKFFSLDDKAKCHVCGHQGCSSTYPCVYCYTPKEDFKTLEQTGADRTVASLAIDYEGFQDAGVTRKEGGKDHFNIVLKPQIFGTIAEHKDCKVPVYHHCMPSGLHYILGIVELFHDNMNIKFPEETADWVKVSTAKKSDNPKQKFKGPDCIKLLECLYVFENKNGDPIRLDLVPYLNCLKSFNKV